MGADAGVKAAMSGQYSRDAERDADLNGARMMAAAGYDPEVLAHLLERLSQSGSVSQSRGWLHGPADRSGAARRAEIIRADIRFYPPKAYAADSGRFGEIQTTLAQLSPSGKQPAFMPAAGTK
jgi:predicted Zn-dependent protease